MGHIWKKQGQTLHTIRNAHHTFEDFIMQVQLINGVRNYETLPEKVRAYFSTVPELTGNPHKVLGNYDQARNNFCTAFASAGCYTYNTGKVLTNEYIEEWARKYIQPDGLASASVIAQQFAKDH